MKRLMTLVGVAVVAAAMYVAAASGSQQAKRGPTAKQFAALKKEVGTLKKQVKAVSNDVNNLAFTYVHCSLNTEIGVSQRGDTSGGGAYGYTFTPQGGVPGMTTALDLDTSAHPSYFITPFNATDAGCQSLVGIAPLRHAASGLTQKLARKP